MREIFLTRGLVAKVDDADFDRLSYYHWHALNGRCGKFYAARHDPEDHSQLILMHREVLNFPPSEVDHWNGNSLDNQRDNLRPANRKQQCGNKGKLPGSKNPFKGVIQRRAGDLFSARIGSNPRIVLGYFYTAEDAARAYDKAAIERWGEFAQLNFPL